VRVLLVSALLFCLVSSVSVRSVCIDNFGKQVCNDFKLLNSVIVKSPLSKNQLKEKLKTQVKQIAFLNNANLFLIDTNNSVEYAKKIQKEVYVIYAQPNISQVKDENSFESRQISQEYNLIDTWEKTKGKGINIAIIDDGFNLEHEDFFGVDIAFSYDVDSKKLDSTPREAKDTHGTQVAGIIFAQHNSLGINGVAPDASLIAIRQVTNITSDTILAFTVANKAGADIINCSWNSPLLLEPVYDVIIDLVKNGRNNKGVAIVFAAGNEGQMLQSNSTEASIAEVITVGARQNYSNYGPTVNFVVKSNLTTTQKDGSYGIFSGTSATAPVISGLIALEMSREPNLALHEIIRKVERIIK